MLSSLLSFVSSDYSPRVRRGSGFSASHLMDTTEYFAFSRLNQILIIFIIIVARRASTILIISLQLRLLLVKTTGGQSQETATKPMHRASINHTPTTHFRFYNKLVKLDKSMYNPAEKQ